MVSLYLIFSFLYQTYPQNRVSWVMISFSICFFFVFMPYSTLVSTDQVFISFSRLLITVFPLGSSSIISCLVLSTSILLIFFFFPLNPSFLNSLIRFFGSLISCEWDYGLVLKEFFLFIPPLKSPEAKSPFLLLFLILPESLFLVLGAGISSSLYLLPIHPASFPLLNLVASSGVANLIWQAYYEYTAKTTSKSLSKFESKSILTHATQLPGVKSNDLKRVLLDEISPRNLSTLFASILPNSRCASGQRYCCCISPVKLLQGVLSTWREYFDAVFTSIKKQAPLAQGSTK